MSSHLPSLICVSVSESSVARMTRALQALAFAEVRLDGLDDPTEDLRPLFEDNRRLIATCREGRVRGRARLDVLRRAIDAGARCVDIEVETPRRLRAELVSMAVRNGVELIVSSHMDHTPATEVLERTADKCFSAGADIAKIACEVREPWENAALLGLLESDRRLVVVGLGIAGVPTRLLAPLLGAEFTFAAHDGARPTAPGQLPFTKTLQAMETLLRAMGA